MNHGTHPTGIVTAEHSYGGFKVQNLAVEVSPGFYATGNLYIPDGPGPFPAVLHPHGHWPNGRFEDSATASVPGRCINLALRGYVSLTYDMLGYGDSAPITHQFAADDIEALRWGISLAGLQTQTGLACLDYLVQQPFVDRSRIACTGASGGGSQAIILAALDRRISAVAPVNMVSSTCQGWCLCENPPGLRIGTNNLEIAALIAPRPLLLISASGDWTSQTPTVEYPQLQKVYALYSATDRVSNVHLDAPHNFNMESRQALYKWLDRWFMIVGHSERYLEIPYPTPNRRVLEVDTSVISAASEREIRSHVFSYARREAALSLAASPSDQRDRLSRLFGLEQEPAYEVFRAPASMGSLRGTRLLIRRPISGEVVACWLAGAPDAALVAIAGSAEPVEEWVESWGTVVTSVIEAGAQLLVVEPFLSRGWRTPYGQLGRDQSMPFFTTYNRTDSAEWVRDLVTAALFGASQRHVCFMMGTGAAAIPALFAFAALPQVPGLVLEATGFSPSCVERFVVPGVERSGGIRAAALLAASRPTVIVSDADPPPWLAAVTEPMTSSGGGPVLAAPERTAEAVVKAFFPMPMRAV
jgi:hypothetical protein